MVSEKSWVGFESNGVGIGAWGGIPMCFDTLGRTSLQL